MPERRSSGRLNRNYSSSGFMPYGMGKMVLHRQCGDCAHLHLFLLLKHPNQVSAKKKGKKRFSPAGIIWLP